MIEVKAVKSKVVSAPPTRDTSMIPMYVIEDIITEIANLKGDNFPNSYYIKVIEKHIKNWLS